MGRQYTAGCTLGYFLIAVNTLVGPVLLIFKFDFRMWFEAVKYRFVLNPW